MASLLYAAGFAVGRKRQQLDAARRCRAMAVADMFSVQGVPNLLCPRRRLSVRAAETPRSPALPRVGNRGSDAATAGELTATSPGGAPAPMKRNRGARRVVPNEKYEKQLGRAAGAAPRLLQGQRQFLPRGQGRHGSIMPISALSVGSQGT